MLTTQKLSISFRPDLHQTTYLDELRTKYASFNSGKICIVCIHLKNSRSDFSQTFTKRLISTSYAPNAMVSISVRFASYVDHSKTVDLISAKPEPNDLSRRVMH